MMYANDLLTARINAVYSFNTWAKCRFLPAFRSDIASFSMFSINRTVRTYPVIKLYLNNEGRCGLLLFFFF